MCSSYIKESFLPDLMYKNEFSQAESVIVISDLNQVNLDLIKHILSNLNTSVQFSCFYFNYHYCLVPYFFLSLHFNDILILYDFRYTVFTVLVIFAHFYENKLW